MEKTRTLLEGWMAQGLFLVPYQVLEAYFEYQSLLCIPGGLR